MSDAPDIAACAELVRRGDPDRFAASLLAAPEDRAALWVLYAFNLEVARAAWASDQPLIAQMRLQFWADTLDGIAAGAPPRAHQVAGPLSRVFAAGAVPVAPLQRLVEARRSEACRTPFADVPALVDHLEATGGGLMWVAAQVLGAPDDAEATVRDVGTAAGLSAWLVAQPDIGARGWAPMPWADADTVQSLADGGLARLDRARHGRARVPPRARAALMAGWQTRARLVRARRDPQLVVAGGLESSEFQRRAGLLWRAVTGIW